MRLLALLLVVAGPAFAAERAPVPSGADAAGLKVAVERCVKAPPAPDACADLKLAYARAILATAPGEARDMAEAARREILDAIDPLDDAAAPLRFRIEKGEANPADKAQVARLAEQIRRLWVETAYAAELVGDADRAGGFAQGAAQDSYNRATSVLRQHGRGPADLEARLRAAGKAAMAEVNWLKAGDNEKMLRESIAEARAALRSDHPLLGQLQLQLADMLARQAKASEAEAAFREGRALLVRARAGPLALADADAAYARFLVAQERRAEGEALHRDVLGRLQAERAPPLRQAQTYLDLSAAVADRRAALTFAERALELRAAALGDKHYDTARAAIRVAEILETAQLWEEAGKCREQATSTIVLAVSNTSVEGAMLQLKLGENLLSRGELTRARYYVETALEHLVAKVGEAHPGAARALMTLGLIRLRMGEAAGRPMIDKAVGHLRAGLPATHIDRLQGELALALVQLLVDREPVATLHQLRTLAAASHERVRGYAGFGPEAQGEMRQFRPVHALRVRVVWQIANPVAR